MAVTNFVVIQKAISLETRRMLSTPTVLSSSDVLSKMGRMQLHNFLVDNEVIDLFDDDGQFS